MKYIYKYQFATDPNALRVDLPIGSRVVKFNFQNGTPTIWVLQSSDETQFVTREFSIAGTGHKVSADSTYIGTAFQGPFVWHLFEHATP
jgi:hypothetical protein